MSATFRIAHAGAPVTAAFSFIACNGSDGGGCVAARADLYFGGDQAVAVGTRFPGADRLDAAMVAVEGCVESRELHGLGIAVMLWRRFTPFGHVEYGDFVDWDWHMGRVRIVNLSSPAGS
jgi:hypothetical protein